MHLIDLYRSFQQHHVRYLLCGGLAINMYGIPRSTADMDIILDLTEDNLQQFLKSIEAFGYQSSIPISVLQLADETFRQSLLKAGLVAISFLSSILQMITLDVLVDVPFSFQDLWAKRTERQSGDTTLLLVGVEDLVSLKEISNSQQDRLDIESLKRIFPDRFE